MAYYGSQFQIDSTAAIYSLNTAPKWCSMRFTAKGAWTVTGLAVNVNTYVSAPTYRFSLHADSAGSPNPNILKSATKAVSGTGWYEVSFAGTTLTSGNVYHVVVDYSTGTVNSTHYCAIRYSSPNNNKYPYDGTADANMACLYGDDNTDMSASTTQTGYQPIFVLLRSAGNVGNGYESQTTQNIDAGVQCKEYLPFPVTTTLTKIEVITKYGYPVTPARPRDSLYFKLCDQGMNVMQSGLVVTSGTVTTSYAKYEMTLSPTVTVTGGAGYSIVLYSPNSDGSAYYQTARLQATTYTTLSWDGTNSYFSNTTTTGASWTDYIGEDMYFKTTYYTYYTMAGYVNDDYTTAVSGVVLTCSGTSTTTTSSIADGSYSLTVIEGSSYTVTPNYNDWVFTPYKLSTGTISGNLSNQNFTMGPDSTWWDINYPFRRRITFGTSHDAVPSGYTVEVPINTGVHKTLITNALYDEGVTGISYVIAAQSNDNLWLLYSAPGTSSLEMWTIKYTASTKTWGTAYKICEVEGSLDAHFEGVITADKIDILHIAYGCHTSQLKYRKSLNTNPVSSTDWSAEIAPSGILYATYPRIRCDDQNRLYIFIRNPVQTNGYIRSLDGGNTWGDFVPLFSVGDGWSAYCLGVVIKNNVIHFGMCSLEGYGGINHARAIGYIKGIINSDTGVVSWSRVDGSTNDFEIPIGLNATDTVICPVSQTSAPWYGSNGDELVVDSKGYPWISYHGWVTTIQDEVYPMIVNWTGSGWVITNMGTTATPNQKVWGGRFKSALMIDPGDHVFQLAITKPPTAVVTVFSGGPTCIRVNENAISGLYVDEWLRVCSGTGLDQERKITACQVDAGGDYFIWVTPNFTVNPDSTSVCRISKKWFAGELAEWMYDGTTWNIKYLTENSSLGHGLVGCSPVIKNGNYAVVWGRGSELLFTERKYAPGMRSDGEDIRIVFSGQELDRVANCFNYENTKLYFKSPVQIPANKTISPVSNMWVYYGKPVPSKPLDDPDNVFVDNHGFELFRYGDLINGLDGWIASGTQVADTFHSPVYDISAGCNSVLITDASGIRRNVGTDLQGYTVTALFTSGTATIAYLGLRDITASKEFQVGRNVSGYWAYYDATGWHQTAYPCSTAVQLVTVIITSNGITASGGGNLLCSNNTYITVFDDLTVSGLNTYWDQIIITKALINPPIPTLSGLQYRGCVLDCNLIGVTERTFNLDAAIRGCYFTPAYTWNLSKNLQSDDGNFGWNFNRLVSGISNFQWNLNGILDRDFNCYWDAGGIVTIYQSFNWFSYGISPTPAWDYNIVWNINTVCDGSSDFRWNSWGVVSTIEDLKWSTYGFVANSTDLRWNISNFVTATFNDYKWNLSSNVYSLGDLRWNGYQLVSPLSDYKWNIQSLTQHDSDIRWNLQTLGSLETDLRWNLQVLAQRVGDFEWNDQQLASPLSDFRWNLQTLTQRTVDLDWSLSNLVSHDPNLQWNLQTLTQRLSDFKWDVGGVVSRAGDLQWNVNRTVSASDSQTAWNILNTLFTQNDLRWNICNSFGTVEDLRWNTYQLYSSVNDVRWNTLQLFSKTGDYEWNISTLVSSSGAYLLWSLLGLAHNDTDDRWNLQGITSKTNDLKWNTQELISKLSDIRWDVLNYLFCGNDFRWDINTKTGSTNDLQWNIQNLATKISHLAWQVLGNQAYNELQVIYDIQQVLSNLLDTQWNAYAKIQTSPDLRWNILVKINFDAQLLWSILNLVANNDDLRWNIQGFSQTQTELKWNINKLLNVEGSKFDWDLLGKISNSADLQWNLQRLTDTTGSYLWDILGLSVGNNLLTYWDVYQLLSQQGNLKWDLLKRLTASDSDSRWDINNTAGPKDADNRWNVNRLIGAQDVNSKWDINRLVSEDNNLAWNIISGLSYNLLELRWGILEKVLQDQDLRWNLSKTLGIPDLNFKWDINTFIASLLELGWDERQLATRDNKLLWKIVSLLVLWDGYLPDKTGKYVMVSKNRDF